MTGPLSFCVTFSGITVRFIFPTAITLPQEFSALQCQDPGQVDAEYEICLLTAPLCPDGPLVHTQDGIQIYRTTKGWLRIYSALTAADGCQVACLLSPNGKNKLYYPASRWDFYADPLRCTHLIGGELLLLRHNAFLLHSSVVLVNGKTVLFSGASGIGKSTQAELWAKYAGAQILNGDRCVIRKQPDGFYGGGSLWAGTSGIYRGESAPIAGIFLLEQSPENSIQRLGFEAFPPLLNQTVVNSWDAHFMQEITLLMTELLAQIPFYRLCCRPDQTAVELAHRTLF